MKITNKVILDLLPLYQAGEASTDTKNLIENYFKKYPEFAKEVDELLIKQLPQDIPLPIKPEDEMVILRKTKRLLKLRPLLMASAIFFTLLPFSFGDVPWSEIQGIHLLWADFHYGALIAIISGIIGLTSWVGYILIKIRLRTTAL